MKIVRQSVLSHLFFFNDTATTEIYTLSLHDALPISVVPEFDPLGNDAEARPARRPRHVRAGEARAHLLEPDRKSTRLNSSHANISYAVFCLKKKNKIRY